MQQGVGPGSTPVVYLHDVCMRRALRIMALSIALGSIAGWAVLGANRGWTKTSIDHKHLDPVTGLEYPVSESRFVPGIDLLALSWISAAVLFVGSLIPLQRKQQTTTHEI